MNIIREMDVQELVLKKRSAMIKEIFYGLVGVLLTIVGGILQNGLPIETYVGGVSAAIGLVIFGWSLHGFHNAYCIDTKFRG